MDVVNRRNSVNRTVYIMNLNMDRIRFIFFSYGQPGL
jgi:hypothetical protein